MEKMSYEVPDIIADSLYPRASFTETCQVLFCLRVLILLYFTKLVYRCEVFTVTTCNYELFNMKP